MAVNGFGRLTRNVKCGAEPKTFFANNLKTVTATAITSEYAGAGYVIAYVCSLATVST